MSALERLKFVTRRKNVAFDNHNDIAGKLWDVTAMLIKLNERIKP